MKIINSILLPLFCLILTISISSCGEDPVPGCTNTAADNYNSLATTEDGSCIITGCTNELAENFNPAATNTDIGACIFPRDKFLGEYVGSLNCLIIDQFNSMTTNVLLEPVSDDVSKITITLTSENFTLPLDATVDGDEMTMMATDFPLTVAILGVDTEVLIDIDGTATLTDSGQELSGALTANVIVVETGQELINDNCTLVAAKI